MGATANPHDLLDPEVAEAIALIPFDDMTTEILPALRELLAAAPHPRRHTPGRSKIVTADWHGLSSTPKSWASTRAASV